jgi:hypothetical protein
MMPMVLSDDESSEITTSSSGVNCGKMVASCLRMNFSPFRVAMQTDIFFIDPSARTVELAITNLELDEIEQIQKHACNAPHVFISNHIGFDKCLFQVRPTLPTLIANSNGIINVPIFHAVEINYEIQLVIGNKFEFRVIAPISKELSIVESTLVVYRIMQSCKDAQSRFDMSAVIIHDIAEYQTYILRKICNDITDCAAVIKYIVTP